MTSRTYGQFCGLAHAMELIGERWALLLIRDLLSGPKRFTDLRNGLPRIPPNILSARLKELEDVVLRLGLWGARTLGQPRPDDVVTTDSLLIALRTTYRSDAARGLHLRYELRVGDIAVHARIDDGALEVAPGPAADPDLVIETGPELRALLAGEIGPSEAVAGGSVQLSGDPKLLERFLAVFHVPPPPSAISASA